MQEPCGKGLAIHANPESYAGGGNTVGEALTESRNGRVATGTQLVFNLLVPCLNWKKKLAASRFRHHPGCYKRRQLTAVRSSSYRRFLCLNRARWLLSQNIHA